MSHTAHAEESPRTQIPDPLLPRDPVDPLPGLTIPRRLAPRRLRRRDDSYESCGFRGSAISETAWLSHAPGTIRTCGLCLRGTARIGPEAAPGGLGQQGASGGSEVLDAARRSAV